MTNEILPEAFRLKQCGEMSREGYIEELERFLVAQFHLHANAAERSDEDYPSLPLFLSLLDTAIDQKHAMGRDWPADRLVLVRAAAEYVIFALLEYKLERLARNWYEELFDRIYQSTRLPPVVISLNYDIIADNSLFALSERQGNGAPPDYGCEISTPFYTRFSDKFGILLKIHGSLNWVYCPGCHRLDVGASASGRRFAKVLEQVYHERSLESDYSCRGVACREPKCGVEVRPVLITPSLSKDYRNPHITQIWYKAHQVLRRAEQAIIVGYSLPEDDLQVIYLLKRGLNHLAPEKITVVDFDQAGRTLAKHPVGARYRTIFGDGVDWHPEGMAEWMA